MILAGGRAPVDRHQSSVFLPTESGCSFDKISTDSGLTGKKWDNEISVVVNFKYNKEVQKNSVNNKIVIRTVKINELKVK